MSKCGLATTTGVAERNTERVVEPASKPRHRLRHVGRAPLPERRAPGGGDGPADERGARRRPATRGVLDHPRPEQLHGAVQGPPGPQAGPGGPEGEEPARRTSTSGAARSRPRRRASTRSTRPTAARTTTRRSTQAGTRSSTAMGRNPKAPWKSQIDVLTIDDEDAISDSRRRDLEPARSRAASRT